MYILYHVSLEPIAQFVPRIPKNVTSGENQTIARICLSESVTNCINKMPGHASSLIGLKLCDIDPIIYIYEFRIRSNNKHLLTPEDLHDMVPDFDGEYWLTKTPKAIREYKALVTDFHANHMVDQDGNEFYTIKDLKYHFVSDSRDNRQSLIDKVDGNQKIVQILDRYGVRTVMSNVFSCKKGEIDGKIMSVNEQHSAVC